MIIGKVTQGKLKNKSIEIEFGESWTDTIVKVNGKKLDYVEEVNIKIEVAEPTRITITTQHIGGNEK